MLPPRHITHKKLQDFPPEKLAFQEDFLILRVDGSSKKWEREKKKKRKMQNKEEGGKEGRKERRREGRKERRKILTPAA